MRAGGALPPGVRLVAVAKERLGHESFLRDHWNASGGLRDRWLPTETTGPTGPTGPTGAPFPSPELYFDTWKGGGLPGEHPLFRACNGASQKWSGVVSYLAGGAVATNSARVDAKGIHGNAKGEGTILGAVLVLDKDGKVLLHHKETSWGDHPSDETLFEAIAKLSSHEEQSRGVSKI